MSKRLITPEYARALIEECEHDQALMETLRRPIRPRHVAFLARQMERGAFGNNLIDVAYCRETEQRFIVNGNHTLRAVVQSGVRLHLTVEETRCETLHDVRMAYSRYDRGLMRNRKDAMRALDAGSETGLPLSHVGYLASAVAFMLDDFKTSGNNRLSQMVGDDELYEEMVSWTGEYRVLREIVGSSKLWEGRIVRRRGVLSVALVTVRADKARAIEFWTGVASGVNIPLNSPMLRLRDYLMETYAHGGGETRDSVAHPDVIARTVAHCWEKFVTGETMKRMRVPAGPVTVKFATA